MDHPPLKNKNMDKIIIHNKTTPDIQRSEKNNRSSNAGFSPLFRTLLDHWVWHLQAFSFGQALIDLHLLCDPFTGIISTKVPILGEGIKTLSERWQWGPKRFQEFINLCLQENEIEAYETQDGYENIKLKKYEINQATCCNGTKIIENRAGWAKIDRRILKSKIYNWEPFSKGQAWVDLLLNTNFGERKVSFKGQVLTISEGEQCRSIRTLGFQWNWTRPKVSRFIELLQSELMVEFNSSKVTTIMKLTNFKDFKLKIYKDEKYQQNIGKNDSTYVSTDISTEVSTDVSRDISTYVSTEVSTLNNIYNKKNINNTTIQEASCASPAGEAPQPPAGRAPKKKTAHSALEESELLDRVNNIFSQITGKPVSLKISIQQRFQEVYKQFKSHYPTLDFIEAVTAVIEDKNREWSGHSKMDKYLNLNTIFKHFFQYHGQIQSQIQATTPEKPLQPTAVKTFLDVLIYHQLPLKCQFEAEDGEMKFPQKFEIHPYHKKANITKIYSDGGYDYQGQDGQINYVSQQVYSPEYFYFQNSNGKEAI